MKILVILLITIVASGCAYKCKPGHVNLDGRCYVPGVEYVWDNSEPKVLGWK